MQTVGNGEAARSASRALLQDLAGKPAAANPSQFTFTVPAGTPSTGKIVLTLNLELLGQQLVPFNAAEQMAVTNAFRQVLDSTLGADNYTVQQVEASSQATLETSQQVLLEVQLATDAQNLGRMLDQLQNQIQNAQLAGQMRAEGLFNLQTLGVVSYTIQAAPAPGPQAGALGPRASTQQLPSLPVLNAVVPMPGPDEGIASPAPTAESNLGQPGNGAPKAGNVASPAPATNADGLPLLMENETLARDAAAVPVPSLAPNDSMPLLTVPAPGSTAVAVVSAPEPAPVPVAEQGPALSSSSLTTAAVPAPVPIALAPVETPAALGAANPASPLTITPVPAPGDNGTVSFTLQLSGSNGLSEQNATALQGALANLIGGISPSQVNVPVTTAPSPVTSAGRRLLQVVSKASRRLLQQGVAIVPVTINAGSNQQVVLQQVNALASSANLTQALQNAGLNVTDARIVSVNGQPNIEAGDPSRSDLPPVSVGLVSPAPAPARLPAGALGLIPVPQQQGWKLATVIWATLGASFGALILAAVCLCCFARWRSSKLPRPDSLSQQEEMKCTDDSSTSADTSPQTGGGDWSKGPLSSPSDKLEVASCKFSEVASEQAAFASPAQDSQYTAGFEFVVPSKEQYPGIAGIAEVDEEEKQEAAFEDSACELPLTDTLSTAAMHEEVASNLAVIAAAGIARLRSIADGASQSLESLASAAPAGGEGAPLSPVQLAESAVMALIASGEVFAGKYMLEEGCIKGSRVIVVVGKERSHPGHNVLCKFFASDADFNHELRMHEMLPAASPVPGIADSFPRGSLPNSSLPGCIVSFQGDYTVAQWPTKLDKSPDFVQRRAAFHLVCKAVAELHRHKCVHGSLTPDNVLWFGAENMFRLSSFSFWAFEGAPILLHPALRYAPPEVVTAHAAGRLTVLASYALDVWSLGVIGFQIFAGQQLFSGAYEDADVLQCLLGKSPMPWEIDLNVFQGISSADARNLIKLLLRSAPGMRPNLEQILDHPLFNGLTVRPPTRLASMPRHPSFPRTAQPRITINPLRPTPSTPAKVADVLPVVAPATPEQPRQPAPLPGSATSSVPTVSPEKELPRIAVCAHTGGAGPPSPPESWNGALFGTPPRSSHSSDSPPRPSSFEDSATIVQNALYAVGVDNPAYSADARSLPSRQESLQSPLAAGTHLAHAHAPRSSWGDLGTLAVAPGSSSQIMQTLPASFPRDRHRWSDSGVVQEQLSRRARSSNNTGPSFPVRRSESGIGRTGGEPALLRTLSAAAGPARARSVAGWESLEDLEARSDVTSEAGDIGPFVLRTVPSAALKGLRGSALAVSIQIEEVRPAGAGASVPRGAAVHEALASGTVHSVVAPMVPSKTANNNGPVFMMRVGGVFLLRVHVAAGSRRGWVPLMVSGPTKMRISFGRSDEGDALEVVETESQLSKWKGYAIWDSNTPRVAQMAGKFGQQTRIFITTTFKRKGSDDYATVEHEIFGILGQRVPPSSSYSPPEEFTSAVRPFPWARDASRGAVTFVKVVRQTRTSIVPS